ncbi:DUF4913 domain-containing protein [Frigoribacterium faeni]|uniref:DUF4913 domain-containing protein n=1 Tax=Frigoribacterium faeni TaxID=145483 RepID=UPI001FAC4C42|nr:DUF4913 domain-containing protein [Frigoribacterium faeni]MCJ0700268.1 DUF4913 domain-containing protein [Frigoribacterium faeni]
MSDTHDTEADVDVIDPDVDAVDPEAGDGSEWPSPEEPAIDWRADFLGWFTAHFATVEVTGSKDGVTWCKQWWKHPEAVARLWALYLAHKQAWELADALSAKSDWWHYHWDHHRTILLDSQLGPFRDCVDGHLSKRRNAEAPIIALGDLPPNEWTPPDAPAYEPESDIDD